MRFAVETWAPEYGASAEEAALAPTEAVVDTAVEVPPGDWAPRTPPPGAAAGSREVVAFVDGVRRVDARVWVTGPGGGGDTVRQGICASWAAGVVRCRGHEARLVGAEVRRALFTPSAGTGAEAVCTRHGTWRHVAAASDDTDQLAIALQAAMADLELDVSQQAADDLEPGGPGLVLVDGPLRERSRIPNAVGYVKTHQRSYLPPHLAGVIGALAAGQRTPVFQIGGRWSRWSWYLRLPGDRAHAWAGVVRCEAPVDGPAAAVAELADHVAATLPRFASLPHKDPRAPQNLSPIAGLERELRHRLGDSALLYRALREAASRDP